MSTSKQAPYHEGHTPRHLKARFWAGGLFAALYGAAVTAAIWAGTSMLAIETEERRAQFSGQDYPTADMVYWPMFYMLWLSLPLVWIWWSWRPARYSGGGLKRSLALAAVALGVTALLASILTLFAAAILMPFMGLILWPMVTLVAALTLRLSDAFWGSTHP